MRTTLLVVFVAGAGIVTAATALGTSSEAHAAGCSAPAVRLGDMSQLMKDPEYREQKRTEISCKLAESGPDIASEVGLTTSQLHQLIDLETNYQIGILDTFAPASPWGQRPDPATGHAVVAEQRELKSQLDSEVIALLGTEKAQLFEAYVKAQSARRQVNALQASLVVEGSPMTPEQQKSLIATITTEQARRDSALADYRVQVKNGAVANKAVMAVLSGELDIDEQANTRIVQAATPVLSPAQLGSLQKMLAEPIARNRLHLQAHASDP